MKISDPVNENYAATVVMVRRIVPLANCDNVVGAPFFGYQSIVGKDTQTGELGILFPPEVQLSDDMCYHNNLYRHTDKNVDQEAKAGYIEDNRRVKAIRFRGHQSDALFMPLSSVAWTGVNPNDLKEGDTFDHLNGKEICRKYVAYRQRTQGQGNAKNSKPVFDRVEARHFPEASHTSHYLPNVHRIDPKATLIVTQKLHGTNVRIANTYVRRKLSLVERVARKLGARVSEFEMDHVYGSHHVVKDRNNPYHNHWYGEDLWTWHGERIKDYIPEGYIVYGEIVGWTKSGGQIQKGYTYDLPVGHSELYVYRVAHVNSRGLLVDLSWDQVWEFCADRALRTVPEIGRWTHGEFSVESLLDKRFADTMSHCVPVEAGKVDEGVCIRVDGMNPKIYKAKSPKFLVHESKMLDEGAVDLDLEEAEV